MELIVYIQATDQEYDLNNKQELLRLRGDLSVIGFFEMPDNKHYWGLFTRRAQDSEVKNLMNSIKWFEVRAGRVKQKKAD